MTDLVFEQQIVRPSYGQNNFASLPGLMRRSFGLAGDGVFSPDPLAELDPPYEQLVFFLVDAFGWKLFERYADHPFLRRFMRRGHVGRATSQFPSTTAAHLTTICTSQQVGRHGLFEWQFYEPSLDAMIVPLLWSWAGETAPELLQAAGVEPATILPENSFFQGLRAAGVSAYSFIPAAYALSTYSSAMTRDVHTVPYKTLPEAFVNLRRLLDQPAGPTCYYCYFPDIDSICHEYGPDSPQAAAEIEAFLLLAERLFMSEVEGRVPKTLLLLAADHGQMAVDPQTAVYLNQMPEFERLQPKLKTGRSGKVLTPGGSPRDVFLYVQEPALEDAQALLGAALQDVADVVFTADLIDGGFFGSAFPSDVFLARVGNLVILPREKQSVWWYEKDRFEQKFHGHHGGLSPDEMEIPVLVYSL